ncbi:hypothetical protein [Amycolatopsis sp. 195334CR]|uniref:hypothetical protein n=1 Tax=Amycolatopsis sp. 195334CR TaxID=2814588 RepID=UPI001A8CDAE5|nr:hypothetical protein [Amycolatopsis sp. 195334CR]MBN6042344.1 hypothetical protein [Amycolatopsis sp. 195334CR]
MAETEEKKTEEGNFIKNYINDILGSTKDLVERDKNTIFLYLASIVRSTEGVIDRVLREVEYAENDIWGSIKAPVSSGDNTAHINELTELKASLDDLNAKIDKLSSAKLYVERDDS